MPGKINLTIEQINTIKELAAKGDTKVNIAKAIERNRSVVDRALKEYDIKLNPSPMNKKGKKIDWNKDKESELIEMYNSKDYSLIDIAFHFNTSLKTITNKGKEFNLTKVESSEITKGDIIYYQANVDKKAIEDMAKERRLTEYGVMKKLKLLGLKEGAVKYSNRNMPEGEKFWEDYINPKMTHAEVADKWNIQRSTVSKWRRQDFGKNFKTKVNRYIKTSGPERQFMKILDELKLTYFFQELIENERVDFYLGLNLIVEINGRYYHSLERAIEKDKQKLDALKSAGYEVIVIWDDELDNINAIKEIILTQYKKALNAQINAVLG